MEPEKHVATKKTSRVPMRQPSWKNKKAPEIRQTLTSKIRFLKANPLATLPDNNSIKSTATAMVKNVISSQPRAKASAVCPKPQVCPKKPPAAAVKKIFTTTTAKNIAIRRSMSAQQIDNIKKVPVKKVQPTTTTSPVKNLNKSLSLSDIPTLSNPASFKSIKMSQISTPTLYVPEIKFKTPSAYQRRSIFQVAETPISASQTKRKSVYFSAFNSPVKPQELQKRLNDWLKKRGKSLSSYANLKCFDIDEENKENVDMEIVDRGSYEDLGIVVDDDNCKANDLEDVARQALLDLHKLIKDGYSVQQCEAWLSLIHLKYKKFEDEPQYWECRAALEEARGNVYDAVECYKTAIVHGAEVGQVDKSLDQLLHKFSLLNINQAQNCDTEGVTSGLPPISESRKRIVCDARNVFKSTIIQFAVQKREVNQSKKQQALASSSVDVADKPARIKMTATPVRRSTRLSRTGAFTLTPGVNMYSTLQEIDSPVRQEVEFKNNPALL